ncbi:hypothetical protein UFOVP172_36 [uncultured Caudovirales phage]|uniref:Uncharacterized protein n=1 Tax=uncultured Caudovirales phage TaxID=2100421 RepID=A0A6J7WBX9_9CAUD|nr:hypothetical protein UFOVP172_36 [uncultured Caudovirales phage]
MNKIDLIIDALENWQHSCLELGRCSSELGLATKALAAARELKALKPVGYMDSKGVLFNHTTHPNLNIPLYALTGETK